MPDNTPAIIVMVVFYSLFGLCLVLGGYIQKVREQLTQATKDLIYAKAQSAKIEDMYTTLRTYYINKQYDLRELQDKCYVREGRKFRKLTVEFKETE